MSRVSVPRAGVVGVIKDLLPNELPLEAWSDARNVRFLDGAALQFLGHGQVYGTPVAAPQYLLQANVNGARYWLYATAAKQIAVTNTGGSSVHTDISHATARAGTVNAWSGFVFGGIPVLNAGDGKAPMYWNQSLASKFVDLTAWPTNTSCKVLRQYKNMMIAFNVTEGGTNKPFLVMWSSLADPGALPSTWNAADATQDAGRFDIGEGQDPIVDGLGLKDSLIVYKESSTYALDYIGGQFILKARKVSGMSGLLNMNCAVAFEGSGFSEMHFAVTGQDIVVHDGFSARSVLDKKARRHFFQTLDVENRGKAFCFKNPFLNEILLAYPTIGATACDTALVYNYVDNTVSFRSLPNVTHAAFGPVDNSLSGNWAQDNAPWESDLTAWNGPDYTPDTARVMMGSADTKLFLLDASASFDGALPDAYLERTGLSFDAPDRVKLITGIVPRITGNDGGTVIVRIGEADTPGEAPEWMERLEFVIGETLRLDPMVAGRYLAIRFETGTAFSWRLSGFDLFVEDAGEY